MPGPAFLCHLDAENFPSVLESTIYEKDVQAWSVKKSRKTRCAQVERDTKVKILNSADWSGSRYRVLEEPDDTKNIPESDAGKKVMATAAPCTMSPQAQAKQLCSKVPLVGVTNLTEQEAANSGRSAMPRSERDLSFLGVSSQTCSGVNAVENSESGWTVWESIVDSGSADCVQSRARRMCPSSRAQGREKDRPFTPRIVA